MGGKIKVLIVFLLGVWLLIFGAVLRLCAGGQSGETQSLFLNGGLFAIIIGLNLMIVMWIIWYYNRYPQA